MSTARTRKSDRRKDLAKIHIAKKWALDNASGFTDDVYRSMITDILDERGLQGRASSATLDAKGRDMLLGAFRRMGWKPVYKGEAQDNRARWNGRYDATGRVGYATQPQLDYIARMETELGWDANGKRLLGFIARQLGKQILPRALRNRQASAVISGLEVMTGRKPNKS